MYECKETAERPSKDRRRVEGLSIVNELFALFCDVWLVFIDFQYVATISKKAQRTHEEGEKKEGRRNHKTATSGVPRELDERTRSSLWAVPAVFPSCRRRSKSCSHSFSGQLTRRNVANCHNEKYPTDTIKFSQLTQ